MILFWKYLVGIRIAAWLNLFWEYINEKLFEDTNFIVIYCLATQEKIRQSQPTLPFPSSRLTESNFIITPYMYLTCST
jgi:hypothetical protein